MKRRFKAILRTFLISLLVAILVPLLPPVAPVYAWQTHTWDTKADFDAGVLTNVDTSYSPGDVVLATNLNTGNGSDGALTIPDGFHFFNPASSALSFTSYAYHDWIEVSSTTGFATGQEVLIIQMTGQGAGNWETNFIDGVVAAALVLHRPLKNTYYADGNSKAQVMKIPNYTNVTINPGGILAPHLWNQFGDWTGGIIFFRATGTVTINTGGLIDVSGFGFNGGSGGGSAGGGAGGAGGYAGGSSFGKPDGGHGGDSGDGGDGGYPGVSSDGLAGYWGGKGGQHGQGGARNSGASGEGSGGGASDQGGTNASTANLSLMQMGGGGGGGSSGQGGYGGGGGGGGGSNTCGGLSQPAAGQSGGRGGGELLVQVVMVAMVGEW
jgi:hypothetical protein